MPKQTKSRALYILKYLWLYTDDEHPASISDLTDYLAKNGIIEGVYADGKTVVASADNTGVFTKIFSGIQKSLEDAGWKPADDSGADSSEKMPFSLVVTGKNSGDFYKYEEPEDNDYYDNPGGGTVPVRSGTFKYNEKKGELKLKFQFEDDIEVSGTLYCTYSADKKTVLVSGEVSGRVLVVVKFSVNISGSKER